MVRYVVKCVKEAIAGYIFPIEHALDSKLRKKLVKCYIWSIALYGAGEGRRKSVGPIV